MNREKKLSPAQRKRIGYILLALGIGYILYYIADTWRSKSALSIIPGLLLCTFSGMFLSKKQGES